MKKREVLLLASQSKTRRAILKRTLSPGRFKCKASYVDENEIKKKFLNGQNAFMDLQQARQLAKRLAAAKALALKSRRADPNLWILGADQLLFFGGRCLGKPKTQTHAVKMLMSYSGQSISLINGIAIYRNNRLVTASEVIKLKVKRLNREMVERVVSFDLPLDCAGGFRIEGRSALIFESASAKDPNSILGLPLMLIEGAMRRKFGAELYSFCE